MSDKELKEMRKELVEITHNWYSPVNEKKPADRLLEYILSYKHQWQLEALESINFDDRERLCMSCTATSKVDEAIAELKKVSK